MKIFLNNNNPISWELQKIAVIGPGIVGMPMAALLANAEINLDGNGPAKVMVVQRNSKNSGWKVEAINQGKSVIGGIEPELNAIVANAVSKGLLSATHNYADLADADMILICVQTDKKGFQPDYGPLFEALTCMAKALQKKPKNKVPVIVFESTLAPSTMDSVIRVYLQKFGLIEGKNILLGNSPNRVMPGRLVERIRSSDKIVAGLHPETARIIQKVYKHIVTEGQLFLTNSLTAEIVKTLENAYRDVRIAFSTEIVRYCDNQNLDFYYTRDKVNEMLSSEDNASKDPTSVPKGGMLIPTLGVGGHCLPKDGILLWWRKIESGIDLSNSLILKARKINNGSPDETIRLSERKFGPFKNKKVAILGTAYRFNSEDTRNSPSLVLAKKLLKKGVQVILHDPYVKKDDQNLEKGNLHGLFTNDLVIAVKESEYLFFATAHQEYLDKIERILHKSKNLKGIVDASNLLDRATMESTGISYTGIGRGVKKPDKEFIKFVFDSFRVMERGLSNEVVEIIQFLNEHYSSSPVNQAIFREVQTLASTCSTGCDLADPGAVIFVPKYHGFIPSMAFDAVKHYCFA
ncbi:MAG: nucleotide sugar dehydrogenase [Bacteroidetes bacterium]|nr:MAG: nucleotide sugar dehydrogenase [Bacteroidota bacterium]